MVTETTNSGEEASIAFITNEHHEKNAWWYRDELEVVNSLPYLLANNLPHPFGRGRADVEIFFGKGKVNRWID
jgi:hypothetical protein